jgi:hypothetical protein
VAHEFVIYRDVPVVYKDKQGQEYYGDVPVAALNKVTKLFEPVVNTRGNAYAARTRMKYRKRK